MMQVLAFIDDGNSDEDNDDNEDSDDSDGNEIERNDISDGDDYNWDTNGAFIDYECL